MKGMGLPVFTFAIACTHVLSPPLPAHAQDAAVLYKSKCAMCHGADGTKMSGHDFSSADVQKKPDADLSAVITDGKPPGMPNYGDKLKPEEIKRLVAYIRTLKR